MVLIRNLFILTFLFVFSIDISAQNLCRSLFTTEKNSKSQNETLLKIEILSDNLAKEIQFLKSVSGISHEQFVNRLALLQRKISEIYIPTISKILNETGHSFVLDSILESGDHALHGFVYPIFVLKPDSVTRLGRFARGIAKWGDTKIAYSPLLNQLHGFKASFFPGLNGILLPINEIVSDRAMNPQVLGHEIKHAQFHAQRQTQDSGTGLVFPVHGYFRSKRSFDPNDYYPHFFSFEELVTYGYSLSIEARQIRQGQKTNSSDFYKYLKVLKNLSSRTLNLTQTSLRYIENLPWFVMDYSTGVSIKIDEQTTELVLLVPQSQRSIYDTDALGYAQKELFRLQKLAQFNLDQIQLIEKSKDPIDLALQLRSLQNDFLKNQM